MTRPRDRHTGRLMLKMEWAERDLRGGERELMRGGGASECEGWVAERVGGERDGHAQ